MTSNAPQSSPAPQNASSNWAAFTDAEPGLADSVERRFALFGHQILATLRKDGSPRTHGLEVRFLNGELWLGMMPGSAKALDLLRDPRFSLQANPGPGTDMAHGDVRLSGRVVEVTEREARARYNAEVNPPDPDRFHLFRAELTEVVRTSIEDEKYLVLEIWRPGQAVRKVKRT